MPSVRPLGFGDQSPAGEATWGDWGYTFANIGVPEMASAVPALARYGAESLPGDSAFEEVLAGSAQYLQEQLHDYAQGSFEELSPAMKADLTADILTSERFWDRPFDVLGAQMMRTAPTMALTGLSAILSGGGTAALLAAAATGGALGTGQVVDQITQDLDNRTDEDLIANYDLYATLRQDGLDEATARKQLTKAAVGAKPLAIFGISAATSAFGPGVQLARLAGVKGLGQAYSGGIAKRIGKEALQGATAEGIEEASQSVASEQALVDAGFQDEINWGNVAQSAITGGTLGAAFGAPAGIRSDKPRQQANNPPSNVTTNANPRAAANNPPGATTPIVQTGPGSMPRRGGNTQNSPPLVPGATPTGSNKAVPGAAARNARASKRGMGAATSPQETPQMPEGSVVRSDPTEEAYPQEIAPTVFPGLPGSLPPIPGWGGYEPAGGIQGAVDTSLASSMSGIVMDPTQEAALATPLAKARRPRTPSQVQQATGVPGMEAARVAESERWRAPQAVPTTPMPAPAPVAEAPTPTGASGLGLGAGTQARAVPVEPAPEPARARARARPAEDLIDYNFVETQEASAPDLPVREATVTPEGRRVLPAAPTGAAKGFTARKIAKRVVEEREAVKAAAAEETAKAKKAKTAGKSKDTTRNTKTERDAAEAEKLLKGRKLTDLPKNAEELEAFEAELEKVIADAREKGVAFRTQIKGKTSPALKWLSDTETLLSILGNPKPTGKQKREAIVSFLANEFVILHPEEKAAPQIDEDTGKPIVEVSTTTAETVQEKEETAEIGEDAEEVTSETEEEAVAEEKELVGKGEDVETIVPASKKGARIATRTVEREVKLLGGITKKEVVAEAASEGVSRRDLIAEYNARLAQEQKEQEAKKPTLPPKVTPIVAEKIVQAKTAPIQPDDKLAGDLPETRGLGMRLHGTPTDTLTVEEGHYATMNIYGQGLYTTDAADISRGYATRKGAKGTVFRITPKDNIKLLDMEQPTPDWLAKEMEGDELFDLAFEDLGPEAKLHKIYDEIRDISQGEGYSADSVQETFELIREKATKHGYRGLSHVGGRFHNKKPHQVEIYWYPEDIASTEKIPLNELAARLSQPAPKKFGPKKLKTVEAPKPSAKAAMSEELAAMNTTPSVPQQEADNFKKAQLHIEGMPISVSTRKDTERQGQDKATGRRWSWLYKFHYGHFLGTKGADGNPIDVFLGPKAWPGNPLLKKLPVVVIDQVDPDTKKFDEHKVMFGFDTVVDAVDAYEKSYPRGKERRGDVVPMSLDEFKAWLKDRSATSEEAGVSQFPEPKAAKRRRYRGTSSRTAMAQLSEEDYKDWLEENEIKRNVAAATATRVFDLSDMLDEGSKSVWDALHLPVFQKKLFDFFQDRVKSLAGDVKVYIVPDEVFEFELGRDEGDAAVYFSASDFIVIRESLVPVDLDSDPEFAALVLHEGLHAAFYKATYEREELIGHLRSILEEARAAAPKGWNRPGNLDYYGLTDIDELIAELNNINMVELLANTKASPWLVDSLKLNNKNTSLWSAIVRLVGRALGLGPAHDTLLSALMRVTGKLELTSQALGRGPMSIRQAEMAMTVENAMGAKPRKRLAESLPPKVRSALKQPERQDQLRTPSALWARGQAALAHLAERYGDAFGKAARTVVSTQAKTAVTAKNFMKQAAPLMREGKELERKYKGDVWNDFDAYMHDESNIGAWGDVDINLQKHLGKDTLHGSYPKRAWPGLNRRYKALFDTRPDLAAYRKKLHKHYRDTQNAVNFELLEQTLREVNKHDPDLAQRLFDETETQQDIDYLGQDVHEHIKSLKPLAKIKGPYVPMMRRGDWVVRALASIVPPDISPNGAQREIPDPDDDNYVRTWEFSGPKAKLRARMYIRAQADSGLHHTLNSVWVDKNTGSRYFNEGTPQEVRVSPQDQDAEQRFRVTVQNEFMELKNTQREAQVLARELENHPGIEKGSVKGVVKKRFEGKGFQSDLMSHQLRTMASTLRKRPSFKAMSAREQAEIVQAYGEAALRMMGSTRIQSRRLPRRHVLGASRDQNLGLYDYTRSMSGYRAKVAHQRELNNAIKLMNEAVDGDNNSDYNKVRVGARSAIANQIESNVASASEVNETGKVNEWINRTLALSFINYLMSPSYSIIGTLQVPMISHPVMAGRFGPGKAANALLKAYKETGALKTLKSGIVATKRALKEGPMMDQPSLLDDIKARVSPQKKLMLEALEAVGVVDADVGIEASALYETQGGLSGLADRALAYTQGIGRQMPRAVEAVNRAVTAVAAYDLEMSRSKDHDAAVKYAQQVVEQTQFIYTPTNMPSFMRHPLARIPFQFRQFGMSLYATIGHNIGEAVSGATPEARAEARKTLAYMAATHVLMAGALGLPTEPFKWLVTGANAAGLSELTWSDVENYEREILAAGFGPQLGEVLARGVTRAIPGMPFDLSSRVGLQDLMAGPSEPRSAETQDIRAYLAEVLGGAAGSMFVNALDGSQEFMDGDFVSAMSKLPSPKLVRDMIKSFEVTSEGKKTSAGYQRMTPYGVGEAITKSFGFTPGREAEHNEAFDIFYRQSAADTKARTTLMQEWATAEPSRRGKMWGQIEKWNYGKDKDTRLTRKDLMDYLKRRKTEEKNLRHGVRVNRRNRALVRELEGVYNQ